MFYPTDFKNRVKKTYPNWDELHRGLDNGDVFVGRYLNDSSYPASISLNTILAATSLEELQEMAKVLQAKVDLYNEWSQLYNEQNPN